jgi:UDP-N-acetylmuramoyl-L-alanyl-D-glutamate--2,6-diaminopimelate ligase
MMAARATVPAVSLERLLDGLAAAGPVPAVDVQGLATDSRLVRPGDLFLASRGLRVHGLAHAAEALERGAVAVVWQPTGDSGPQAIAAALPVPALPVPGLDQKLGLIADRFYARPSQALHLIGVTGTDGKTSVTHFIAQALAAAGQRCGLIGTLGYGLYGSLQAPTHTTPDAVRLHAELAALRERGAERAAM